jgi:tartrate-resistant acid phosphatase type 5
VGQFYHAFIHPYHGQFGPGADRNRFFPSLGNHDWQTAGAKPYLDYFTLPGNERYYDFEWGPLHLFALDSDPSEPDGVTAESVQGAWLKKGLEDSHACWQIVYFHHPPFSSGPHAPSTWMRWPFRRWGADAVMAGHDHIYERIHHDDIPYFVNGLGGSIRYEIGRPVAGSQVRYQSRFGAMLVTATRSRITYEFVNTDGDVIDTYTQVGGCGE